ncbi:hypothetical protein [Celeribacter neptunius]|uniref:hypothetical protein n=1 Tax=Celeribacter neptunius TaxID=588602 RepID=UPI0011605769|nr:hypothetical protein [Celeribacter neptunius]
MSSQNEIDPDIVEAIADALKGAGLQGTPYGKKFEQRIKNKLVGQFDESDLFDLIGDLPLPHQGKVK